jgi:hypothetical protein
MLVRRRLIYITKFRTLIRLNLNRHHFSQQCFRSNILIVRPRHRTEQDADPPKLIRIPRLPQDTPVQIRFKERSYKVPHRLSQAPNPSSVHHGAVQSMPAPAAIACGQLARQYFTIFNADGCLECRIPGVNARQIVLPVSMRYEQIMIRNKQGDDQHY